MRATVSKWGNSLAVRIPRSFAAEAGVGEGTEVDITVREGTLLVTAVRRKTTLEELLDEVTSENLHGETETGAPRGREVW